MTLFPYTTLFRSCCCKAEVEGAVSFATSCFLLLLNSRWASVVGLGGAEASAAVFFSATTSLVDVTFCFLGRGSGSSSSPLHKGEDLSSTKRLRKEGETILKLTWRSRRQNRQRRMTFSAASGEPKVRHPHVPLVHLRRPPRPWSRNSRMPYPSRYRNPLSYATQ